MCLHREVFSVVPFIYRFYHSDASYVKSFSGCGELYIILYCLL